jgi:N utilization substance protein A
VIIDEDNRSMEVIVPDEFLSIAIGKKGQNVRLASKLTGWHLDVKSESAYNQAMQSGYNSLMALPGVGISLADALYEKGFYSAEEIAKATREELLQIRGVDEPMADSLIEAAQAAVEQEPASEPEPDGPGEAPQHGQPDPAEDEAGDRPAADPAASSTAHPDGPTKEA